jgi:hypothetical protein
LTKAKKSGGKKKKRGQELTHLTPEFDQKLNEGVNGGVSREENGQIVKS